MSGNNSSKSLFRVSDLSQKQGASFSLTPSADALREIESALGLQAVRKVRFEGDLSTFGKRDWQLNGKLGATVVQSCVVTLEPVTTRIDTDVTRQFIADYEAPSEEEYELTDDENIEPLPTEIDVFEILKESLALALPPYPRKENAELTTSAYTEPGKKAMTDEDVKPFAGLAALRDKLSGDSEK